MADGSRRILSYVREPAWSLMPIAPAMKSLRNTGGSGISIGRNPMVSGEFRADRMIAGVRMGANKTALSVPFEFSADSFDDMLEAAMFGRWEPATGSRPVNMGATTIVVVAAGKTFTRSAGSFLTDGFSVGDYVMTSGFTNPVNNGVFLIATLTALVMTVNAASTLVDEAAAANRVFARWGGLPVPLGATTLAVDGATKTFTRSAGSFLTDGLAVGDLIKCSGFVNGPNNAPQRVTALTATVATCANAVGLVTEAAAANRYFQSMRMILKVGTEKISFTIEEAFLDIAKYRVGKGMMVNAISLSLKPGAIVTGSLELLGQGGDTVYPASIGAPSAPPTTDVIDSFTGAMREGGANMATVTGLDLKIDNGLDAKPVLFSRNPQRVAAGRSNTTGNIAAYLLDSSLLEKFLNETPTSLEFDMISLAGNKYTISVPKAKYTGHQNDVSENDIVQSLPFQALYDAASGTSLVITKNPEA